MPKRTLDLELDTGSAANSDHPASKMFEGASRKTESARKSGTKKKGSASAKSRKRAASPSKDGIREAYRGLKPTDKAVIDYLKDLCDQQDGGDTCTAGIPEIAQGANVSERQVQISTRRLITVRLLERVGYDFGNPDLSKRGTIYKVFI